MDPVDPDVSDQVLDRGPGRIVLGHGHEREAARTTGVAIGDDCNFFDVTYSRLMGMGLDASETIGLGCPQCKLRFAHGRATPSSSRM